MKLLKLIPAAAIVLSAFTTFEAKAGPYGYPYPSGWSEKNSCNYTDSLGGNSDGKVYKLQKTDTPASYGAYQSTDTSYTTKWLIENVSYDCATNWYKYGCGTKKNEPTCTSWRSWSISCQSLLIESNWQSI